MPFPAFFYPSFLVIQYYKIFVKYPQYILLHLVIMPSVMALCFSKFWQRLLGVKWCPTTTCEDIGKKNSADLGTTPFGSVIESNGCFYLQFCVKEAQNLVETWYMWNKYLILYSYQHNIISKMWICFIKELESNRELQIPDETSRVCVCVCVCEGRALWKRMQIVENHRRKEGSTVRSWLT